MFVLLPCHAPTNLQTVPRVDPKEDPQNFCSPGFGFYFFQVIVFPSTSSGHRFLFTKATFQLGGPFFSDLSLKLSLLFVMFAFRAFGLKIGLDTMFGNEPAVDIGRIDGIGSKDPEPFSGKALCLINGTFQSGALIEVVKTNEFDKVNAVYL